MAAKEDNELVYEVIRGNVAAFEVLVDRYQKIIFKMVLRMVGDFETAKDLTQDIFVKAFEKMGSFNFKYRFFSWIYRIAINETLSWIRRNPRMDSFQDLDYPAADTDHSARRERKSEMLELGLLKLPPDYRILVHLKYYEGLSYEEVAEAHGISVVKVRSRLFIAREQLRKTLVQKGFFENE